ncbi:hypothetical protein D5086_021219 [Populus alba]|uniref:Uncharacterized protein n=2 Tax=Populus TaxID=3689 RepID=A0ACC4BC46_POPAL
MKLTAEGYFITANSELRNLAKEWLKTTAEGCSVVAVLIATVAFAAAYTVPGGPNQSTGVPVLVNKPFFVVFTVTDVLSLTFALTSVVTFLSILTSPFRFKDFKHTLPNKLMVGFAFLFLCGNDDGSVWSNNHSDDLQQGKLDKNYSICSLLYPSWHLCTILFPSLYITIKDLQLAPENSLH